MKEPKRYYCGSGEGMFEDNKNGDWIEYSEYKAIMEELSKPLNYIKNHQTAIDWLYEQIEQSLLTVGYSGTKHKMSNLKKQAKKLEKQQMKEAVLTNVTKREVFKKIFEQQFESYYEEKFENEN